MKYLDPETILIEREFTDFLWDYIGSIQMPLYVRYVGIEHYIRGIPLDEIYQHKDADLQLVSEVFLDFLRKSPKRLELNVFL